MECLYLAWTHPSSSSNSQQPLKNAWSSESSFASFAAACCLGDSQSYENWKSLELSRPVVVGRCCCFVGRVEFLSPLSTFYMPAAGSVHFSFDIFLFGHNQTSEVRPSNQINRRRRQQWNEPEKWKTQRVKERKKSNQRKNCLLLASSNNIMPQKHNSTAKIPETWSWDDGRWRQQPCARNEIIPPIGRGEEGKKTQHKTKQKKVSTTKYFRQVCRKIHFISRGNSRCV